MAISAAERKKAVHWWVQYAYGGRGGFPKEVAALTVVEVSDAVDALDAWWAAASAGGGSNQQSAAAALPDKFKDNTNAVQKRLLAAAHQVAMAGA